LAIGKQLMMTLHCAAMSAADKAALPPASAKSVYIGKTEAYNLGA
jgi:hypothetical protein